MTNYRNRFKSALFFLFTFWTMLFCPGQETKKQKNTPPQIEKLEIFPSHLTRNSRASIRIWARDKDNDPISYKIKWFVNNSFFSEEKEIFLSSLKKHDRIYVQVIPFDGKSEGETFTSSIVTIENNPPLIKQAAIKPDTIFSSTERVEIIAKGEDIDGDSLSFLSEWFVNNKKIEGYSEPFLNFDFKRGDVLNCIVYAFDGQEKSKNFASIQANVKNAPPFLNIQEGSIKISTYPQFSYQIPASDPDNDPLSYSLLSSSVYDLKIEKETGIIKGKFPESKEIKLQIKIEDSQGAYLITDITLKAD